jgi:hypothetical protein
VEGTPSGDLEPPTHQAAPEGPDLDRLERVDHVVGQAVDELQGELGVVVAIELSNGLLRVPGGRHLAFRVAGTEQP